MPSHGSVTKDIPKLQDGDSRAVQHLWDRYMEKLKGLARKNLRRTSRLMADEEDVALSAFFSFCRAAREHRFDQLDNRDGLWKILVTITIRKAINQARYNRAERRDSTRTVLQSELTTDPSDPDLFFDEQIRSDEPDPQIVAEVTEQYEYLLNKLAEKDPKLRIIAEKKIGGQTNKSIAEDLDTVEKAIEKKMTLIRKIWLRELDQMNR